MNYCEFIPGEFVTFLRIPRKWGSYICASSKIDSSITGDTMNQIELLSESKVLTLALVIMGIVMGLSVLSSGSADPWNPWPWP